jgi:LysM repeat protein
MNRKNTILIAVMINAGLLAVLLITALTTQEEIAAPAALVSDVATPIPSFDDKPLFKEPMKQEEPFAFVAPEALKIAEIPEEPLVHKLPPLVPEALPTLPETVAAAPALPALSEVTVKKGDNLEKIAKAHRTTVAELIKTNHLSSHSLKIGQVLKIPAERTIAAAAVPPQQPKKTADLGPEYYTMKVGDNPWAIAMKHHMKVQELLRLNGLNEERARKLKPGDRLRIK